MNSVNIWGVSGLTGVKVLIRYDVENISDDVLKKHARPFCRTAGRYPFTKKVSRWQRNTRAFSVEFLPGQFDQRADSAVQCVKFLNEEEEPVIRSATTYVIEGEVSNEEFEAIKHHCINPVDSRGKLAWKNRKRWLQNLKSPRCGDSGRISGYAGGRTEETVRFFESCNDLQRLLHIQNYFKSEEHRDPSMTEIRVLDTY